MRSLNFQKGFIVISVIYLTLMGLEKLDWAWYLKPLLIPFLFFSVVKSNPFKSKKWLLAALLFSWIGDVILLFADKSELFFIFGLVAFLLAHILFIILFINQEAPAIVHKEKNYYWFGFGLVLLYLFGMLSILLPKLGSLKFPVGIYAMTISLMLIETIKGYFNWTPKEKIWIVMGATLFVISDSLLAFNKFYCAFSSASFFTMVTYLAAQYCITKGVVGINKNSLESN